MNKKHELIVAYKFSVNDITLAHDASPSRRVAESRPRIILFTRNTIGYTLKSH